MNGRPVLVVESDPGTQLQLTSLLQRWGYTPVPARSPEEASAALSRSRFLFSLVDGGVVRANSLEFLRQLRSQGRDPGPIIMLSGRHTIARSEEVPIPGADAIIQKPVEPATLEHAIGQVLTQVRPTRWQPPTDQNPERLEQAMALWRSPKMQRVREIVAQAARVSVPVLVRGETGTGKGLVARAIHRLSPWRERPFITVNCTSPPEELVEGELFGAPGGVIATILLDHIGDLDPASQTRLLRLLEGGLPRGGGESTAKADFRVLATANQDLEAAVQAGRFRQDLYYRLNVIEIVVPPLRERPEEIPLLVNHFIEQYSREFQRERLTLPPHVMAKLLHHQYPGNVRELENLVKRLVLLDDPTLATPQRRVEAAGGGSVATDPAPVRSGSLKEIGRTAARAAEREVIAQTLEHTGWNRMKAARLLKISYRALLYKIKEAGLAQESSAGVDPPELNAG